MKARILSEMELKQTGTTGNEPDSPNSTSHLQRDLIAE